MLAIVLDKLFKNVIKIPVPLATSGGRSNLIKLGLTMNVDPSPNPAFKRPDINPIVANLRTETTPN
jgi:hypothetical protein